MGRNESVRAAVLASAPAVRLAIEQTVDDLDMLYARRLKSWKDGSRAGMTHAELAAAFGVANSTVAVALKRERDR